MSTSPNFSQRTTWLLTLASAALFTAAHQTWGHPGLAALALTPLLIALTSIPGRRTAALAGLTVGFVFFATSLYPLVSALNWTGWVVGTADEMAAAQLRQWYFLHGVWFLLACWGGLFWALFALTTRTLGRTPGRFCLSVVAAWLLFSEVLRSWTTWGFEWDFLGHALATQDTWRQGAALGGTAWLTITVLALDLLLVAAVDAWRSPQRRRAWRVPAVLLTAFLVGTFFYGRLRLQQGTDQGGGVLDAAVVQHSKDVYTTRDFAAVGIDRSFLLMLERDVPAEVDLAVLPETISFGALSVDGTQSAAYPDKPSAPLQTWTELLARIQRRRPATLVIGVELIEDSRHYNSLVVWQDGEVAGWYHKQRLVPFAEYPPSWFATLSARGRSQFSAGDGPQLITTDDAVLGLFICQEVLFPGVTRRASLAGATVLASGGNDGVFTDPRVAEYHGRLARIRATETGRPLLRSMKSGRSAVIDRHGRELASQAMAEPAVLEVSVRPEGATTLFVRLGNWLLPLSVIVLFVLAARTRSESRPSAGEAASR